MDQLIWCDIKTSRVNETEISASMDVNVKSEKQMYGYQSKNIWRSARRPP